jgi:hypothetical protein
MALQTLTITFGGLCMLVQRTKPAAKAGLYVLMPNMTDGHHSTGHDHCPIFVCATEYVVGGNGNVGFEHLKPGDTINLSALTSGTRRDIREIADVSEMDGGRKVDKDCLEATHPRLAARVVLPLPPARKGIVGLGKAGKFKAPNANGNMASHKFHGMLAIEYTIENPGAWDLKFKGTQLQPDADGHLEFALLNVRPKDLNVRHDYMHRARYPWTHPRAYHHLLTDALGMDGPPAIIDETGGSETDTPDYTLCPDLTKPSSWPVKMVPKKTDFKVSFIDPFTCTLGGGCPPGESC